MISVVAKPLDFIVIGASKSGTTALFQYLRAHPRLYLPADKDVPFFASDEQFERGWPAVGGEFFSAAPEDALWGAVTPRYMEDPRVPERMFRVMPGVKLIAILRNPIDRAFSHYRQQVRRGKEERTFESAVEEQARPEAVEEARTLLPGTDVAARTYLVRGEYGRILEAFLGYFAKERLLVVFSEDLMRDPQPVVDRVIWFLGLEPGYSPPNLGKRYHQGGTRERFPRLIPAAKRIAPLRWVWRLLSRSRRRAIWTWFFTQVNVIPESPPELSAWLRARLVAFFRPDVSRLESLIEALVPWEEFRHDRG